MEYIDGIVYHVRSSRSVPDTEVAYIAVNEASGNDDRVFPIHVKPETYSEHDKVKLMVDGRKATILE